MLQVQSQIKIIDNSGGKLGQIIKVYKKKTANIGDLILLTIKKSKSKQNSNKKLLKGSLFKALIVRSKFNFNNFINRKIKFSENSVILLNSQYKPIGTRIIGPIPISLRKTKHFKIISIAATLI